MNIFDKIAEWSQSLPDWQSDAVRRILVNGRLTETDRAELIGILKASKGIEDPNAPALGPRPLDRSHIPTPTDSAQPAVLKSMRGLKHVNALAPDQTLTFAPAGLTVIYGDNASGKSGYARVLKKACRARGEAEDILPNVFAGSKVGGSAEAIFDLSSAGQDMRQQWVDGEPPPDGLAAIAVFDSKVARFYVDEKNEVVYIPYGLDVFNQLGDFCRQVKAELEGEVRPPDPLPAELQAIESATWGAQVLLSVLKGKAEVRDVEAIGELTQEQSDRLAELTKLIAQFERENPKVLAAKYRRLKTRIENIRKLVQRLDDGLSPEKCSHVKTAALQATELREAARLASQQEFSNEPLRGVGSDPWREMFEAARRYSEKSAYPGEGFPVTKPTSRCVLCQQELGKQAKERLQKFDDFVKRDTERKAAEAAQALEEQRERLRDLKHDLQSVDRQDLDEIGEVDGQSMTGVEEYLSSASALIQVLQRSVESGDWESLPSLSLTPARRLRALEDAIEERAARLESAAEPEAQRQLRAEHADLESRKILWAHKQAIIRYVRTLRINERIRQCLEETNTSEISRQGKVLMRDIVIGSLKEALQCELNELGVCNVRLSLAEEARSGTTYYYLRLDTHSRQQVDVSSVLSEGEQCAVAIGSFLAEVGLSSNVSGLVFDDPVSSLDHRWRHRFAGRLVREGLRRQVIVFTHDIVFLLALRDEASKQGVPILTHWIRRGSAGPGMCEGESLPWDAKNLNARLNYVDGFRTEAKQAREANDEEGYWKLANEFYDLLRKSWERCVEEVLFNKVIERFGYEVKTRSLDGVLVTDDDYKRIYQGMAKCSSSVHDTASALAKPPPDPSELLADIQDLRNFVKELTDRKKQTEQRRKELLNPPSG